MDTYPDEPSGAVAGFALVALSAGFTGAVFGALFTAYLGPVVMALFGH